MVGTIVSHYRVLELLGAGGMGVVYLAEDQNLRRKVALKFLPPALAADATAQARFSREAQSASALDHANIATVYEIGEWNGQPFIAMAYYDGETLKQRIDRGPMDLREVANFGFRCVKYFPNDTLAGDITEDHVLRGLRQ